MPVALTRNDAVAPASAGWRPAAAAWLMRVVGRFSRSARPKRAAGRSACLVAEMPALRADMGLPSETEAVWPDPFAAPERPPHATDAGFSARAAYGAWVDQRP